MSQFFAIVKGRIQSVTDVTRGENKYNFIDVRVVVAEGEWNDEIFKISFDPNTFATFKRFIDAVRNGAEETVRPSIEVPVLVAKEPSGFSEGFGKAVTKWYDEAHCAHDTMPMFKLSKNNGEAPTVGFIRRIDGAVYDKTAKSGDSSSSVGSTGFHGNTARRRTR